MPILSTIPVPTTKYLLPTQLQHLLQSLLAFFSIHLNVTVGIYTTSTEYPVTNHR